MKRQIIAVVCGLVFTIAADAQGIPRRDRGESPRDQQRRDAQPTAAAMPQDPFAALERELPSLKVDLRLAAELLEAWNLFERDVRSVAELDRVRRRHLMSLRDADGKPPTALAVVATLVEDERQRADASGDLQRHLEALYARLDESQKRMLDRRVVQSQTEPLGR